MTENDKVGHKILLDLYWGKRRRVNKITKDLYMHEVIRLRKVIEELSNKYIKYGTVGN
jgi:hypothetical protein